MNNITVKNIKSSMPSQKKKTDKLDLWVNIFARPTSYYLTWLLLKLNVTATQTSLGALIVGVLGSIALMNTSSFYHLIGVILINLWIVFDCADGNVARVTKTSSKYGELMDAVSGYLFVSILYMSIGISATLNTNILSEKWSWILIIFGAIASIASILPRLIEHKTRTLFPQYNSEITDKSSYNIYYIVALNVGGMAGLGLPLLGIAYMMNFVDFYIAFYSLFHSLVAVYAIRKTLKNAKKVQEDIR